MGRVSSGSSCKHVARCGLVGGSLPFTGIRLWIWRYGLRRLWEIWIRLRHGIWRTWLRKVWYGHGLRKYGMGYGGLGYGMLGFGLWGWPGAYGRMLANAQMFKRNMHYDPFSMPVMNPYQTIGDYAGFADQLKAATGDAERPYKNVEFGAGSESSPKSRKRRSHRVKSGYHIRRLPSVRPWNMMGYNYPGFAYNPYYSYSKAAYYNFLNRMLSKSFYNKHGPRK